MRAPPSWSMMVEIVAGIVVVMKTVWIRFARLST
jgi:hypothetical protein